ncbi:MAG: hypothetical protein IKO62_06685 [Bacteroidales bacterium]|nr:hypothetical protein [Bacteroidales bacterium]
MDILITILIVVSIVGWEYLKIKRKMASEAQKAAARKKAYNVDEEYPEGGGPEENFAWKNEKFETDSSKSEPYFTYESVPDQGTEVAGTASSYTSMTGGIHLQEVENETETNDLDLHNPDELKKAIIYGEILKNPYN